jgi:TPR repeat protein
MAQKILTPRYLLFLGILFVCSVTATRWLLAVDDMSRYDALIDNALQYSIDGNHIEAVKILKPLADHGVLRAQLYMGVAYYHGNGIKKDWQKAQDIFFQLQSQHYEMGIVNTYLNLLGSLQQT